MLLRPEWRRLRFFVGQSGIPALEGRSQRSVERPVRVCKRRCAPRRVHCICCFLANRLLTTRLTVASTKVEEMHSRDRCHM